ncbi:uncharacterized protein [Spinacia oleracea]|uniref:Uncharacterized protein isoform X2 n=1 Tax=Spinacia oleracea TaxID=3562 RepID=A0ABM3QME4_SPIOL|nr:uncharacterized protein LOC110796221 isoform X2 [Spinacia oleracea]
MPPTALSKNKSLASSGDIDHELDYRRTSRQHQTSRFAREKPLSPRTSQSLKFKDKCSGSHQQPQERKGASKEEEELVKYMSKVPGFLQRGEKVQDNALNFGVLDWGRLQKWTHKHEKTLESERITRPAAGSCSSSATENSEALFLCREQPGISNSNSAHILDFSPVVKPLSRKPLNRTVLKTSSNSTTDEKQKTSKKNTHRKKDSANSISAKYKENSSSGDGCVLKMSDCNHEILAAGNRKVSNSDSDALKCCENIEGLRLDTPHQYFSGKQEGIVLLLPKDFSGSASSEVHHRSSLDGKSVDHNWGSFSDIFSIDEIHPDESFYDIPHSCSLKNAVETEKELDLKLDTLIRAQGIESPVNPSNMSLHSTENKIEVATSTSAETAGDSLRHRFSSGIARMTKSLSFREGSVQPPISSTYVSAKSGPAKPECFTYSESRSIKANMSARARASPLRRLLDPFLKSKVPNQVSEKSNELIMKQPIPTEVAENEKHEASTVKALLHLSVKSGLPLFKFVVEIKNEIFATTVKTLSTLEKDGIRWLYTFCSVNRAQKRSGGRKIQGFKRSGFGYNVVGQMTVSEPHFPSWCKQESNGGNKIKESVLYSVGVNNIDGATSEFKKSRELAAIVGNMPDTTGKSSITYDEYNLDNWFSDLEHENLGHVVVILPGSDHSLPHEGVPSSLINRWRSGGSCDCGGWDIGCKLRILTDRRHHKVVQTQFDLYDQGEAKKHRPFFRMIPLRNGLFSVEFDAKITSLQAFSVSVALINSRKPDTIDQGESKEEFGGTNASMDNSYEGHDIYAPPPPLSPVGRV